MHRISGRNIRPSIQCLGSGSFCPDPDRRKNPDQSGSETLLQCPVPYLPIRAGYWDMKMGPNIRPNSLKATKKRQLPYWKALIWGRFEKGVNTYRYRNLIFEPDARRIPIHYTVSRFWSSWISGRRGNRHTFIHATFSLQNLALNSQTYSTSILFSYFLPGFLRCFPSFPALKLLSS